MNITEKCKIFNEDCETFMNKMVSNGLKNIVQLTVTSPPYDSLRTYSGNGKLDYDKFKRVADLLYTITKPGGIVIWVVGDSTVKGSETGTSFKQALYFKEIGFNLHDTMIYEKANPIPQNHNRYEQCFEYMFVLSKGKPSVFNPIRVPTINGGKKMNWGDRKTVMDKNQCRRHREREILTTKDTKIHKNIFTYPIGGTKTGHPAVFPYQLAEDQVLTWSNEGDLVFDPFVGSGTTGLAALRNKRKFIGIDNEEKYCKIAVDRLKEEI